MSLPELSRMIGMISAVALPFCNLPLSLRIQQRRSSYDISLAWAVGVWLCLLGMLPSGLASHDPVFRIFTVFNLVLFSAVLVQVLRFR